MTRAQSIFLEIAAALQRAGQARQATGFAGEIRFTFADGSVEAVRFGDGTYGRSGPEGAKAN